MTGKAGTLVYTPSARLLMRKQASLREAIAQVYPRTEAELEQVVRNTLSFEEHTRLCRAVKDEALEVKSDLHAQAASGRWIW